MEILESKFLLVFRPTTEPHSSILSLYTCSGPFELEQITNSCCMSSEYKGKQKWNELPDDKSMEISFCLPVYLLFQEDSFIIAVFYVTCSQNGSSLCEEQRPERKNYPLSQC